MSVVEQVLEEELERVMRLSVAMEQELERLPKGSIRKKPIRGRTYYYLTHREGDKVLSDYIRADDVEALGKKIERRKELKTALVEQRRIAKQLRRALGIRGEDGRSENGIRKGSATA